MEVKYKFNIDKYEITYTCHEQWRLHLSQIAKQASFGENGDVVLIRIENTVYENSFEVHCSNLFVGTLLFGSYNKNRPYIYLSVNNEILYSCVAGLSYIEQALHLEYFRVSKLDICMDTNLNFINRFYRLLKDENVTLVLNNDKIIDRNQVINKIVHFSSGSLKNIRKIKSFSIKGNEIELFGYDKTAELAKSNKEYIKENLGFTNKIFRLEIRIINAKQIRKALTMCQVDMTKLYFSPSEEQLKTIFVLTLNRIIRISPNVSILKYILDNKK